ncbi:MAG: hypothetical protein ACKVWR_07630 [Acidimicrobiales bacterium]
MATTMAKLPTILCSTCGGAGCATCRGTGRTRTALTGRRRQPVKASDRPNGEPAATRKQAAFAQRLATELHRATGQRWTALPNSASKAEASAHIDALKDALNNARNSAAKAQPPGGEG